MRRPWIGITTYHREPGERPRFTLPSAYVDAVRAAGGMPVLLAPGDADPEDLLRRLDGLVLSGGGDLDPALQGDAPHPSTYFVCAERDAFEMALVTNAAERGLPTLAICRGMQVLNVALGGDIHPHVPDAVGGDVPHRRSQDEATEHAVEVAPRSRLAGRLGGASLPAVPSWHHQAVRNLGQGLEPVAWAADGIVEALELAGCPSLTAVQWHPELEPAGEGSPGGRLFLDLLRAAEVRGTPGD